MIIVIEDNFKEKKRGEALKVLSFKLGKKSNHSKNVYCESKLQKN